MSMFTVRDAIGLAAQYGKSKDDTTKYNEAILGNYMLADSQIKGEEARRKTGAHLVDNAGGNAGKLVGHVTFGSESPYAIEGLAAAQAGKFTPAGGGTWMYQPSKEQFARDPQYMDKLMNYYQHEKGKGIDIIQMPDGRLIK